LISENEEDLIQTIRSRCQILHFNGLSEPIITEVVAREQTDPKLAAKLHIKHRKLQHCLTVYSMLMMKNIP
jgi:DNA polymerase III delta prime subunit